MSCDLIGLLIIAVCSFQRFSDRSFVTASEVIVILKLEYTAKYNFQNTKNTIAINISLLSTQQRQYVF